MILQQFAGAIESGTEPLLFLILFLFIVIVYVLPTIFIVWLVYYIYNRINHKKTTEIHTQQPQESAKKVLDEKNNHLNNSSQDNIQKDKTAI